jgi:hypothetical protein
MEATLIEELHHLLLSLSSCAVPTRACSYKAKQARTAHHSCKLMIAYTNSILQTTSKYILVFSRLQVNVHRTLTLMSSKQQHRT